MQTPTDGPSDVDAFLLSEIEDDLLSILLAPPRVPSFAAPTVPPPGAMRAMRRASPLLGRRHARAVELEAREEARRTLRAAAMLGLCSYCEVNVTPDGKHRWDCVRVPTERRENSGRQP